MFVGGAAPQAYLFRSFLQPRWMNLVEKVLDMYLIFHDV